MVRGQERRGGSTFSDCLRVVGVRMTTNHARRSGDRERYHAGYPCPWRSCRRHINFGQARGQQYLVQELSPTVSVRGVPPAPLPGPRQWPPSWAPCPLTVASGGGLYTCLVLTNFSMSLYAFLKASRSSSIIAHTAFFTWSFRALSWANVRQAQTKPHLPGHARLLYVVSLLGVAGCHFIVVTVCVVRIVFFPLMAVAYVALSKAQLSVVWP